MDATTQRLMLIFSNLLLTTLVVVAMVTVLVARAIHGPDWSRLAPSKDGNPLPPGPPSRRFWDHIMPTENISSTLNNLAKEYGPVFTLRRGREIFIVVARVKEATEIMEREGSALVDRPPMIAANEFLSGGKRITLTGSGERFRRLRKAIHTYFQAKAVEVYKDILLEQAKMLIVDLLDDGKNHRKLLHRYTTSIILRVTYGKSGATSIDDPDFVGIKQIVEHFIEGMRPGVYLVDRFPWLKHVPGYGRRLKSFHDLDLKFYQEQLNRVKHAMLSDSAGPSFGRMLLETGSENRLSFDEMAFLAGTIFEAGSDTTADALIVMTMAAACFPDAQLRVQEELDSVIGVDRLPSWTDVGNLPNLRAFILEALRWRPVTPLGFSHRSTRDIVWRGYHIPAGATVHGNQWAISRDPDVFPDPEIFDPQRWLDQNGHLRSDLDCYPFGFGRRICPGMYFANRSMFIGLAFILWSFQISELPEAPIDTTPDMDSVVAHMAPFEVRLVPRIEMTRLREVMVV